MKSAQIWKDIPGFTGYQVSNDGIVRRGNRYIKQHKANGGGLYVNLGTTTRLVHKLVWIAFMGPPTGRIQHINGDRRDNRLSNLRCAPGRSKRTRPHYKKPAYHGKRCSKGHELVGPNVARWGRNRICVACRNGVPPVTVLPERL